MAVDFVENLESRWLDKKKRVRAFDDMVRLRSLFQTVWVFFVGCRVGDFIACPMRGLRNQVVLAIKKKLILRSEWAMKMRNRFWRDMNRFGFPALIV